MNKEEIIAKNYLETLKIGSPVYEPDGNIPPDFSINEIGIEVRRLNQNYFKDSSVEGLEQRSYTVLKILEEVLREFDSQYSGKSYWIGIRYRRPIGNNKQLKNLFRNSLNNFISNKIKAPTTLIINNNIHLNIFETNKKYSKTFMHGITSDTDSGGFVNAKFIENVSYCIMEKSKKILPYKNSYKIWWLILINRMGIEIDNEDVAEVRSYLKSTGNFEKVIIVNSTNFNNNFILQNGL